MTRLVRPAEAGDLPAMGAIYAHYVTQTAITFDVDPPSPEDWRERFEQARADGHPWFVVCHGDELAGFATCGPFRPRPAYDSTVETAIYMAPHAGRRGHGRAVYEACLREAAARSFHVAVAAITLPNPASVGLHEALGFTAAGVLHEVGHKLGAWRDVGWWELALDRYRQGG